MFSSYNNCEVIRMGLANLAKMIKDDQKKQSETLEERFLKALDSHFLKSESRKGRLAFRPSGYYKCKRSTYYFLSGEEGKKTTTARSRRILDVGTELHSWIQDKVLMQLGADHPIKLLPPEELPRYKEIEVIRDHGSSDMEVKFLDKTWTKQFPVSAMVDGWLEFENTPMLFEFKTINHKDFEYLIEPLVDHTKQGALYALCTGVMNVLFLYLDKNTQELKAFVKTYTPEQVEWVRNLIVEIEDSVLSGTTPPPEASRQCSWCEYKGLCAKEQS